MYSLGGGEDSRPLQKNTFQDCSLNKKIVSVFQGLSKKCSFRYLYLTPKKLWAILVFYLTDLFIVFYPTQFTKCLKQNKKFAKHSLNYYFLKVKKCQK